MRRRRRCWTKRAVLASVGIATLLVTMVRLYMVLLDDAAAMTTTRSSTITTTPTPPVTTTTTTTAVVVTPPPPQVQASSVVEALVTTTKNATTLPNKPNRNDDNDNNKVHQQEKNRRRRGKLYTCGFDQGIMPLLLFPEYAAASTTSTKAPAASWKDLPSLTKHANTTVDDVLYYGMGRTCGDDDDDQDGVIDVDWVRTHFPGKVLLVNGESRGLAGIAHWNQATALSNQPTSRHNIQTSFFVLTFLGRIPRRLWPVLTWHEPPPPALLNISLVDGEDNDHDWKKKKFAAFLVSNCVARYRLRAAYVLSSLGTVCHARCVPTIKQKRGPRSSSRNDNDETDIVTPVNHPRLERIANLPTHDWSQNYKVLAEYRYCLVMENANVPGYITEKLLMAFVASCIPLWYGTPDVFDMLNRDAFIYWNVTDPTSDAAVLAQIRHLEANATARRAMQEAPKLAHGNATLRDYFSWTDDIGGGRLKHQLRVMMGIEDVNE